MGVEPGPADPRGRAPRHRARVDRRRGRDGRRHRACSASARPRCTSPSPAARRAFEPERFSLLWQRSILQSLRASLRETQRARAPQPAGARRRRRARWPSRCSTHGDRLLGVVRRAAHPQARRRAHPRPRRPPPRPGAVDRPRRRVHRLRGRARALDRRALDQALAAHRRRRASSARSTTPGGSPWRRRPSAAAPASADAEHLERWRRTWTTRMQDAVLVDATCATLATGRRRRPGRRLIPADHADARCCSTPTSCSRRCTRCATSWPTARRGSRGRSARSPRCSTAR